RTLERLSPLHTFQACAFNHSATCPTGCAALGKMPCGVIPDAARPNRVGEYTARPSPASPWQNLWEIRAVRPVLWGLKAIGLAAPSGRAGPPRWKSYSLPPHRTG